MAYETLPNLKAVLNIAADDTSMDSVLTSLLTVCSDAIDQYCQRTFATVTNKTRTYYAPKGTSSVLWVDDLLTPVTVTVDDGTPLVLGTDYEARPLNTDVGEGHYDRLVRLSGLCEVSWHLGALRRTPKVAITGTWGYSVAIPSLVVEVCQIMASRLYDRRKTLYANQGGLTEAGISLVQAPKPSLDADCKQMLSNYVRKWSFAE